MDLPSAMAILGLSEKETENKMFSAHSFLVLYPSTMGQRSNGSVKRWVNEAMSQRIDGLMQRRFNAAKVQCSKGSA